MSKSAEGTYVTSRTSALNADGLAYQGEGERGTWDPLL